MFIQSTIILTKHSLAGDKMYNAIGVIRILLSKLVNQ